MIFTLTHGQNQNHNRPTTHLRLGCRFAELATKPVQQAAILQERRTAIEEVEPQSLSLAVLAGFCSLDVSNKSVQPRCAEVRATRRHAEPLPTLHARLQQSTARKRKTRQRRYSRQVGFTLQPPHSLGQHRLRTIAPREFQVIGNADRRVDQGGVTDHGVKDHLVVYRVSTKSTIRSVVTCRSRAASSALP